MMMTKEENRTFRKNFFERYYKKQIEDDPILVKGVGIPPEMLAVRTILNFDHRRIERTVQEIPQSFLYSCCFYDFSIFLKKA